MATRRRPVSTLPKPHPNAELVPEGQRECPICKGIMQTSRRGDAYVDVCGDHGIWLDASELERMFRRRARAADRRVSRVQGEARLAGFYFALAIT